MKLKSFSLVEAIIATAIVVIFIVAMGFISTKASASLDSLAKNRIAKQIASDYFSYIRLAQDMGKLDVDCFDSSKFAICEKSWEQINEFAPLQEMISVNRIGDYRYLKKEYLQKFNIPEKAYKFKSVIKSDCNLNTSSKCKKITVELIWESPTSLEKFESSQFIFEQ